MTTQETRPRRRYVLLHGLLTAGVMSGHMAILPINGNELLKRPVAKVEAPAVKRHSPSQCAPKSTNRSVSKETRTAQKTGWSTLARWFL